jgi:nitroreductase
MCKVKPQLTFSSDGNDVIHYYFCIESLYLIISVIKEHEMADYFDLLKTRRSIRDFDDKNAPLDIIRDIIRESCLAPSSGNGQPWRFIIINERALIKRLSDESKKNLISYIEKNPDAPVRKYEDALRNKDFNVFYKAPCLIYILGLKEIGSAQIDCTLAASYLMFSAAARGLGTCWVALGKHIQDPGLRDCGSGHCGLSKEHPGHT